MLEAVTETIEEGILVLILSLIVFNINLYKLKVCVFILEKALNSNCTFTLVDHTDKAPFCEAVR